MRKQTNKTVLYLSPQSFFFGITEYREISTESIYVRVKRVLIGDDLLLRDLEHYGIIFMTYALLELLPC
jgi:hypothetical protein